jgi:hypothetical protein
MKVFGPAMTVADIGMAAYEIIQAEPERRGLVTMQEIGGWIGGFIGGALGGLIGTCVFPVVGTVIGGILGAGVGGPLGRAIGRNVYEWLFGSDSAGFEYRGPPPDPINDLFLEIHDECDSHPGLCDESTGDYGQTGSRDRGPPPSY